MSMRYKGAVLSATAPTTSSSSAVGIWTMRQQLQAVGGTGWPKTNADFIGILTDAGADSYYNPIIDSAGNVYCCGYSYSGSKFKCLVTKYSPVGTLLWQKVLDSVSSAYGFCIAIDSSNNIYVAGRHNTTDRIFLVKYDTSGNLQWQKTMGSNLCSPALYGISVDSSGNIYIGGYSRNSGNTAYVTVVIKCDTSGVVLWSKTLEVSGSSAFGRALTIDSSSNSYISGAFSGARSCLAKYNSSGTLQWQTELYSGTWNIDPAGNTVDSSGNIYVSGQSSEAANNGAMIAKYNSSGVLQWKNILQGAYVVSPSDMVTDASNNLYVAGSTGSSSGISLLSISKYNSAGVIQWQRTLTASANTAGYGISLDSIGNFIITGITSVSGNQDCLIVKLPVDGSLLGTYVVGAYTFTYAASSLTLVTSAATSATSSYTDANDSIASSAGALVETTGTLTSTVTTI